MNSGNHQTPQRRRHTVAGTLLTILLVAAWLMAAGVLGGSGSASVSPVQAPATEFVPVAVRSYVVQPGDTLWSVARSFQPSGDVRPLVDRLSGRADAGRLRPGQRISLS